jgi:hypothetical protein
MKFVYFLFFKHYEHGYRAQLCANTWQFEHTGTEQDRAEVMV